MHLGKKQNKHSLKFKTTKLLHQKSVDQSVHPTRSGPKKFNTSEVHDKNSKLAVMKMLRDLKEIMKFISEVSENINKNWDKMLKSLRHENRNRIEIEGKSKLRKT